jgi:chemotaxis protein CheX
MSLNPDVASSKTLTEERLAKYIVDATQEVFSTMVMMDAEDDYPLQEPVQRFKCSITGMVGFAGIYSGVISVHCPVDLALKITSNMLGIDCDEVNEDLNDAIGEIANMLGGGVKQVLSKGGQDVKLSIPTVISGEDYTVNSLSDMDCVVIPFRIGEDKFLVGLTLKKEE